MHHSIITILTTSAIAIHAVLGCCAHHSHASCLHGQHETTLEIDEHEHAVCEHHAHTDSEKHLDDNDSHGEHQDGQEPCGEADCQFVSIQRTDDILNTFSLSIAAMFDALLPSSLALVSAPNAERFEHSLHSPMTPEPLHALKQVWLL